MFLRSEMHTDALLAPLSLFCSLTQQTASSLPLHLVRSHLQSSALAPLFYIFSQKTAHANISWPGVGFLFSTWQATSLLWLCLCHLFLFWWCIWLLSCSCTHIFHLCMCTHWSGCQMLCWPDLHLNVVLMFSSTLWYLHMLWSLN